MSVDTPHSIAMQVIRQEDCNEEVPEFAFNIMNELIDENMDRNKKSTVYEIEFIRTVKKVHNQYIPRKWISTLIKSYQESGWNVKIMDLTKKSTLTDVDDRPSESEILFVFSKSK